MTSLATPRASTACPPGRSPGARSTTVTSAPRRRSQWASAGPAMLAPATNTLLPLTAPPAHPSGSRSGSYGGLHAGRPGDGGAGRGGAPGHGSIEVAGCAEVWSPWLRPKPGAVVRRAALWAWAQRVGVQHDGAEGCPG